MNKQEMMERLQSLKIEPDSETSYSVISDNLVEDYYAKFQIT